jgi:hypothetical protein
VPVGADFDARLALKQIADVLGNRSSSPPDRFALCDLRFGGVNWRQRWSTGSPAGQVFFVAAVCRGGRATVALLHHQTSIKAFISGFGVWLIGLAHEKAFPRSPNRALCRSCMMSPLKASFARSQRN